MSKEEIQVGDLVAYGPQTGLSSAAVAWTGVGLVIDEGMVWRRVYWLKRGLSKLAREHHLTKLS